MFTNIKAKLKIFCNKVRTAHREGMELFSVSQRVKEIKKSLDKKPPARELISLIGELKQLELRTMVLLELKKARIKENSQV